jgi:signal transduction histidine kinase
MTAQKFSPGELLLVAGGLISIIAVLVTWLALQTPWTGLSLNATEKTVVISAVAGPSAQVPLVTLTRVSSAANPAGLSLIPMDALEDPHTVGSYTDMNQLFSRQQQLWQILQSPSITLQLIAADGKTSTQTVQPIPRTLSSLPFVFWFQLIVSSLGFMLGCWIWVLRPQDMGARMFGVMNCMYPLFAFPAAIYSTRDLALSGDYFHILMMINTCGSYLFGCALMALFLSYPKQLVKPVYLWLIPLVFMGWFILDCVQRLPDPSSGSDLPVTLEMFTAILFAVWQWFASRRDPMARAALRWFAVSVLTSCGLFVFLVQSSSLIGVQLGLSQGYAFGFFLLMNIGLALGLRRYRLFDLDEWAFRILYWVAGALALIALDALLILKLEPALSLGLATLICALIWLPVRGWIQQRIMPHRKMKEPELFKNIIEVSFATSSLERGQRWQALVQQLFDPLHITPLTDRQIHAVTIEKSGLGLLLPATTGVPALQLDYPWQGRKLFSARDVTLASQLLALMQQADTGRLAYDRGAQEERGRIARDLHDDIGSRLMLGLHQQDMDQTRQTIRHSLAEIRTIVSGLAGGQLELAVIMQELYNEIEQRLEAAGIALSWTLPLYESDVVLGYTIYKNYISIMRELINNIVKHAQARTVTISTDYGHAGLVTTIRDDGIGMDSDTATAKVPHSGHGLNNLKVRLEKLNGSLTLEPTLVGTRVHFVIPVQFNLDVTA